MTLEKLRIILLSVLCFILLGVSAYFEARFTDTKNANVSQARMTNLALGKRTTASSQASMDSGAEKATDGDHADTFWSPSAGKAVGEWLEVDFGREVTFGRTAIEDCSGTIAGYKIQYWNGRGWKDAFVGGRLLLPRAIDDFAPVTSSKVRLLLTACGEKIPTIYEFQVYRQSSNHR